MRVERLYHILVLPESRERRSGRVMVGAVDLLHDSSFPPFYLQAPVIRCGGRIMRDYGF